MQHLAGNVPDIYKPFYGPIGSDADTVRSRLPFETISIRRTGCFGDCPIYEVVLYRDGMATMHAEAFMPLQGKFVGEVSLHLSGRLCHFIERIHFSEMDSRYEANWTDAPTCIVTVIGQSMRKEVSDYGGVGPIDLWALQELLDAAKNEIEWKPAS
jgi:hypothetical protein